MAEKTIDKQLDKLMCKTKLKKLITLKNVILFY